MYTSMKLTKDLFFSNVRIFPLFIIPLYSRIYEVVHERQGKNSKELTVQKGEILEVGGNKITMDKNRNQMSVELWTYGMRISKCQR